MLLLALGGRPSPPPGMWRKIRAVGVTGEPAGGSLTAWRQGITQYYRDSGTNKIVFPDVISR